MLRGKFSTRLAMWVYLIPLLTLQTVYGFQSVKISGKVSQADGSALSGATVAVKGSRQSVTTDKDGNYNIAVPNGNATLVISYVGFAVREIAIDGRTQVDITMAPASTELTNVVVMGYGTQTKRDVTGAVKSLKTEDFNRGVVTSP